MLNLNEIRLNFKNEKEYSSKIKNLILLKKEFNFNIANGFILNKTDLKNIQNLNFENIDRNKRYIVRSAAIGEDGTNNSFAGIFKSIQNVEVKDLRETIKEVNDSFYSKKSIVYQKIKKCNIVPQILIQEMIESKYSIVVFIKNDKVKFSFTEGNCSKIVSGEYNVEEFSFNIKKFKSFKNKLERNLLYKEINIADFLEKLLILTLFISPKISIQNNNGFLLNEELKSIDIEATYNGKNWYLLQYRELNI